jgi:hypothetical protein
VPEVNDVERWILLDGLEPEHVAVFLDVLRDLPPATPADAERAAARFLASLGEEPTNEEREEGEEAPDTPEPPRASREAPASLPPEPAPASTFGPGPDTVAPHALRAPDLATVGATATATNAIDPPPAATPPVAGAPARPAVTLAPPDDVPAPGNGLPFGPPRPEPKRAAITDKMPAMPANPFGQTDSVSNTIATFVATLPYGGAAPSVVPIPDLSLMQYASLRAELEVRPWQSADIFRRYGVVNMVVRFTLDRHWVQCFLDHPDQHAVFQNALAQFTGYLRLQPG